jgi:hypothetical protein
MVIRLVICERLIVSANVSANNKALAND